MKRWVAVYSRSGSEIYNLSKLVNRVPDLILTNKKDFSNSYYKKSECAYIDNSIEDWSKYLQDDDIITLHGYLKIVPDYICDNYNLYNGHPGLITKYPELAGFNPQEKALNKDIIGSVIHKVTSVVDGGEILYTKEEVNKCKNIDCMYTKLAEISLSTWVDFSNKFLIKNTI